MTHRDRSTTPGIRRRPRPAPVTAAAPVPTAAGALVPAAGVLVPAVGSLAAGQDEPRAAARSQPTGKARAARIAATVSAVLSSGVFFGTVASLTPSKRRFDRRTYVTVQQATIRNLRPVMGVLLPVSVLANLAVLVTTDRADSTARRRATTGLLGPLASLLLTAGWELPINARVMSWHPGHPPVSWTAYRDRWEKVHLARTATALVGLAGTLAITTSRADQPVAVRRIPAR